VGGSRSRWGWHRLDPAWATRLVGDSGVGRGDLVVDIGAGTGALTAALLDTGARVIAVERHRGRAATLRQRFGDDIVLVTADATDLRLPRQPFHVVANPPFAITSAVLDRLLHPGSRLRSAHVVMQVQAARRWSGPTAPRAGRWQPEFDARMGRRLPRSAFSPAPHVDTCVLQIARRRL
jgi:23S rRNA (adenine-N6)-dimethyltransferase